MSSLALESRSRAANLFLIAGVALTGIYFALPKGGIAQSTVYEGLGTASALLTLWALRVHRPRTRLPWILFALGNATSVVGDVLFDIDPNAQSPDVSDAFYLAAYPLLAAALLILLVRTGGHHRFAALAEAGIATVAFALLQWVFLMHPALDSSSGSWGARAVAEAYPAGDVVLLAGLAGFFVSPAWRRPSFGFLVGAIAVMIVGDELYGLYTSSYASGDPLDTTWMLSYVLFGVAALHPSMRELSEPRRRTGLRVSGWRIALLTGALLTPAGILLEQWARGARPEIAAVVTSEALIAVLVVSRLTGILRALERLRLREREARAEAVEARELLAGQNERLLAADRLKDEFVALVSHDLRTPLTSIMGYTELALEETDAPLDDERRSFLEVVSRSAERLLRLVDDLLFVARLQAGRGLDLEPTELDLALVAAQAADEARPRAQAKGLELVFSGDGPVPVHADRGRVFQLLDNLVTNALKFTPEGGTVEICVEATPDGGALEVRDDGIGLGPGEAERLFDRFYRSSRAEAAQVPGTGLGLFIARAIADAHGGSISASSPEAGGTVFRIELPARMPVAEANEAHLVA